MKRFIQLAAVAAAFALYINAPAEGAQPVTTSVQIPLAGTVFVPLCDGSTDAVLLSGMVHVVTQFTLPDPISNPFRFHVNLDQVSAIGDISGLRYNTNGSVSTVLQPTDPIYFFFNLIPSAPPCTPPLPRLPLEISFVLSVNPDTGELLNVDIEEMSVPLP